MQVDEFKKLILAPSREDILVKMLGGTEESTIQDVVEKIVEEMMKSKEFGGAKAFIHNASIIKLDAMSWSPAYQIALATGAMATISFSNKGEVFKAEVELGGIHPMYGGLVIRSVNNIASMDA